MVIPTRQAPPVPTQNRGFTISNNNQSSRYTPTTDWDDNPFDAWTPQQSQTKPAYQQQQQQQQQLRVKKQAPPRPPPPKTGFKPAVPLKKPSTVHSNTILANLLSRARLSKPNSNNKQQTSLKNSAPLPQPIVPTNNKNISSYGTITLKQSASFSSTSSSITSNEVKLISFDSPPSSPTFTQKSNSDCVSVNSFSSDSANYSPNNGFSSESGFEDDFVLDNKISSTYKSTASVVDPFDMLDEAFTPTTMNNGIKPPIAQKPVNVGNTSFYAFSGNVSSMNTNNSKKPSDNYDPLCNGKDLIKPSSVIATKMPTIIRPNSAGKGKISPVHSVKTPVRTPEPTKPIQVEEFDDSFDDSLPSLPMPSIPPPPPPKVEDTLQDDMETESYGIALYDFDGEQDADLPLRVNEKIYLMRRLNNEWLFGRNKRGCEGMFPANFIDVKIPLCDDSAICSGSSTPSVEMGSKSIKVRALYDFHAEHPEDLSLTTGDTVTILRELNSEWLYGETSGRYGQFPANYVDYQSNSY